MTTHLNYSLQDFSMNNAKVLTGNSQPVPDFKPSKSSGALWKRPNFWILDLSVCLKKLGLEPDLYGKSVLCLMSMNVTTYWYLYVIYYAWVRQIHILASTIHFFYLHLSFPNFSLFLFIYFPYPSCKCNKVAYVCSIVIIPKSSGELSLVDCAPLPKYSLEPTSNL